MAVTDSERVRLRAVAKKWRETAAIWDEYIESKYTSRVAAGVVQPPSGKTRSDLKNWVNWLNSCAQAIEQIVGKEH